jgi:hypothetical protein
MKYFCKTCGIDVESGSNCPIGQEGVLTPCEPIDEPSPFIKLVGIWKGDDLQECMEGGTTMAEQEKQAIRESYKRHKFYGDEERLIKYIPRLLDALEERDREVERLKDDVANKKMVIEYMDDGLNLYKQEHRVLTEEIQRLRKELQEVYENNSVPIPVLRKIGKALAGEEKKSE